MKLTHAILWASALITLGGCSTGVIGDQAVVNNGPTRNADGSCPYNVTRGTPNSWLLDTVEMHFDFWGNYPQVNKDTYQGIWDQLLNHDQVLDRLAEYGIHRGSLDVNYSSNNPNDVLPNPDGGAPVSTVLDSGVTLLDDSQVVTEINHEIQWNQLPYPNDNTLYMIMLPPGTLTAYMYKADAGGRHDHSSYNGQRYAYALISYHGDDEDLTDEIISHELGEAATDPDANTGYRDYTNSQEIGDICTYIPVKIGQYGYTVQRFWSQISCQCQ